jgi:hypothetical protein
LGIIIYYYFDTKYAWFYIGATLHLFGGHNEDQDLYALNILLGSKYILQKKYQLFNFI